MPHGIDSIIDKMGMLSLKILEKYSDTCLKCPHIFVLNNIGDLFFMNKRYVIEVDEEKTERFRTEESRNILTLVLKRQMS